MAALVIPRNAQSTTRRSAAVSGHPGGDSSANAGRTGVSTTATLPSAPAADASGLVGPSAGQLVAVGLDILIDGLLVGIAFAAGGREGLLLTAALSLELLSLGLAVASTLAGGGRWRSGSRDLEW